MQIIKRFMSKIDRFEHIYSQHSTNTNLVCKVVTKSQGELKLRRTRQTTRRIYWYTPENSSVRSIKSDSRIKGNSENAREMKLCVKWHCDRVVSRDSGDSHPAGRLLRPRLLSGRSLQTTAPQTETRCYGRRPDSRCHLWLVCCRKKLEKLLVWWFFIIICFRKSLWGKLVLYLVPLQPSRSMSSSGVDSMMACTSDFSRLSAPSSKASRDRFQIHK